MKTASLIAAAALAASGARAAAFVDFNAGVSIPGLIQGMKEGPQPASPASSTPKRVVRWLGGVERIELPPGRDSHGPFDLSATAIVEECEFDPRGGMRCRETFGHTVREKGLRLVIRNRGRVNGSERFQVVLEGRQLWVEQLSVQRPYKFRREGQNLVLAP